LRKKNFGPLILVMIISLSLQSVVITKQSPTESVTNGEDTIDILLLMDDEWGVNCNGIIDKMESFGWNITYGSTSHSVAGCDLNGNDVKIMDVLVSEITNVSQFDCISILPGEDYPNLYQNSGVNCLLQNAVANEVYVSSWCKAIKIFADADIIDGKNVTGNDLYKSLAEAAGATFFSLVPPITDGFIITAVRSRYYQMDTCIAIAKAVGVYETDPPVIESIIFDPIGENDYNINVTFSDATDTISAKIIMNALTEVRINDNLVTYFSRTLTDENCDNTFEYTFMDLPAANYSIDIETQDAFWNEITYGNETYFCNLDAANSGLPPIATFSLLTFGFVVIVAVINRKQKRTY